MLTVRVAHVFCMCFGVVHWGRQQSWSVGVCVLAQRCLSLLTELSAWFLAPGTQASIRD